MTSIKTFIAAATLAITAPAMASAVTLGVLTNDYGTGPGQVDPGGSDIVSANSVQVSDASSGRFFDTFDLSPFAGDTITGLALTLDFEGAGPSLIPTELWSVRIQGSNSGGFVDDVFIPLADALSPQTITINPSTDLLTVDAFSHSVALSAFEFWFSESTPAGLFGRADEFTLNSATLEVFGEPAVVALPASATLLLLGLGGLAISRKRA